MKALILRHGSAIAGVAVAAAVAIGFGVAGWKGALGIAGGIAATWIHAWLLWRTISVLGEASRQQPVVKQGTAMTVIGFVIQLPIFILIGFGVARLGQPALYCFVTGLGMVYFGLVGWGVAHT